MCVCFPPPGDGSSGTDAAASGPAGESGLRPHRSVNTNNNYISPFVAVDQSDARQVRAGRSLAHLPPSESLCIASAFAFRLPLPVSCPRVTNFSTHFCKNANSNECDRLSFCRLRCLFFLGIAAPALRVRRRPKRFSRCCGARARCGTRSHTTSSRRPTASPPGAHLCLAFVCAIPPLAQSLDPSFPRFFFLPHAPAGLASYLRQDNVFVFNYNTLDLEDDMTVAQTSRAVSVMRAA